MLFESIDNISQDKKKGEMMKAEMMKLQ